MADFLDEKRKEIQARLKELRPLVDEYHRLEAAEQALSGVGGPSSSRRRDADPAPPPRCRRGHRPPWPPARLRHAGRAGRAAREGPPGITIPEIAEKLGMKQNYLYRVMPQLASDGKIVKSGRGWHVAQRP